VKQQSLLAGAGAVAFGVLAFVAMMVANPPGGNYSAGDVADFLSKGHRPAVFLSVYLMLIAAAGLLIFLARLRDTIPSGGRSSLFWGFAVASVGAWVAGYALVIGPSAALAFSGGHLKTIAPDVAYVFSESGWAVMYGAGGLLLGCALATLVVAPAAVPSWVRWFTAIAAVCALAALAWFPFFVVYLWAVVLGVWTLVSSRSTAPAPATQAA
jgi:hypothetical protein